MNGFLLFCREANVVLGIAAGFAVGYRAVLGFVRREIAYRPLFIDFMLLVFLVGLSSGYSLHAGYPISPITPAFTALLAKITITCLFVGGNRKGKP